MGAVQSSWSNEAIEQYARSAAAFLQIEIQEEDWPAVLANVRVLRDVSEVLLAAPINDDVARGPVFRG